MLSYDPDAFLIGFAIVLGGIALVCVFIIHLNESVYNTGPDKYVARLPSRFAAMIVDITILRLFIEILLILLIPSYISPIFVTWILSFMTPNAIIAFVIFAITQSLSSYLFFYILLFGNTFSGISLLVGIGGFLYFFVFDAFMEGKTVGRLLLRIKTVHSSKKRTLSPGEAVVNAIGKTLLLLDLFLGTLVSLTDSRNSRLRQFRLTQKFSGAATLNIHYDMSEENNSQSFTHDENDTGALW